MRLILASTSPRRQELLSLLQIPFEVVAPVFEEDVQPGRFAEDQVQAFARGKAKSCAVCNPDAFVLGSDTLIACDGDIMGKPADAEEARSMLRRLAGRAHVIYTAISLQHARDRVDDVAIEPVRVWMKPASEQEIDAYVSTGESLGKAGSYAIQGVGARLIDRIEGDYPAAVGLPLRAVATMLEKHGVVVPVDVERLYGMKPYANWPRFA